MTPDAGGPVSRSFVAPSRPPLTIVRGEGASLWDAAGRRYVDLGASHGVGNLGVSHPEVVRAVQRQAAELLFLGSGYDVPVRTEFLARLTALLPPTLDRVFLSNSGTEAVEAAIKFARAATGRSKVVAAMRGFHGRTMGSLSATWRKEFREGFEPLVPGFVHVPFNDVEALRTAVDETTALLLLEPVQGEGGVHPASAEFLEEARRRTTETGTLLALDEVQTGLGRTGRLFAFERWGVVPDLLTLAKSLAGGVPIGATVTTEAVQARFHASHHSTFGGSPLACAAGVAALEVTVRERLAERAERLGAMARERLSHLPREKVREVRGLGLLIGVEMRERVAPYLVRLEERGFLAIPAGPTVLRLIPPLVIEEEDLRAGLEAVEEVIGHG
ncbi:MAG TPA: aminotransferase class III-fold pyridoxal phosphate-dependent enzyme [Thermoplasmata archaeon]|nr:aminotransferase class III-fold pyridoxal phosphate-dependent enzyme [Thermoplasmata archaeon]